MTFSLTMTSSDLLLLLPEILLTFWLCFILIVDFSFPRLHNEQLAYFTIAGLVATLGCLVWFDIDGITGTLFANMFALDRIDRKSTRLNSSHSQISYAVFCLKKKKIKTKDNIYTKQRSKKTNAICISSYYFIVKPVSNFLTHYHLSDIYYI